MKLIPSLLFFGKQKYHQAKEQTNKKQQSNKMTYHPPHVFREDTITHMITEMTSISKAYIFYLFDTIWSHKVGINIIMVVTKGN